LILKGRAARYGFRSILLFKEGRTQKKDFFSFSPLRGPSGRNLLKKKSFRKDFSSEGVTFVLHMSFLCQTSSRGSAYTWRIAHLDEVATFSPPPSLPFPVVKGSLHFLVSLFPPPPPLQGLLANTRRVIFFSVPTRPHR